MKATAYRIAHLGALGNSSVYASLPVLPVGKGLGINLLSELTPFETPAAAGATAYNSRAEKYGYC